MTKPSVAPVIISKLSVDSSGHVNSENNIPDLLAVEEPLEIRIGYGDEKNREQKSISVTMRTPGNDFELAIGFLFTEGIITGKKQIQSIRYCTEANTKTDQQNIVRVELNASVEIDFEKLQRNFYTTSSCGICGKASIDAIKTVRITYNDVDDLKLKANLIVRLPEVLSKQQLVFGHTGGLHACALFNMQGELLLMREDVGRHNALDKLIGAAVSSEIIPLQQHVLLLSGRASFELLQKAAMAGIKIICAVGAPSSLAVETANEFGITLIGFLRDNRFNVYSNAARIAY